MKNLFSVSGYSLLELVFATGLVATLGSMSVPAVLTGLDEVRTAGAVRFLVTTIQRARTDAVARSTNTAVRFVRTGPTIRFGIYADGNGDGVRTTDIQHGVDKPTFPDEQLSEQFPGIEFGVLPGLPAVDASSTPPGTDPVKAGASDMLAFTPLGTSSSGSLYVLGPRRAQYVVRVYGASGRVRVLKFNEHSQLWSEP